MKKDFFVYMLTNKKNGTLYTGVTSDLVRRVFEHKEKIADGFTKKYGLGRLVYFEVYNDPATAIHREKCIKEWRREWKVSLIEKNNPEWTDLYEDITGLDSGFRRNDAFAEIVTPAKAGVQSGKNESKRITA